MTLPVQGYGASKHGVHIKRLPLSIYNYACKCQIWSALRAIKKYVTSQRGLRRFNSPQDDERQNEILTNSYSKQNQRPDTSIR